MEGFHLKFSETAATSPCSFGFEVENARPHATLCRTRSHEVNRSRLETAMAHTIATISATVELCPEKLSDN
jgi:hypothetical protein